MLNDSQIVCADWQWTENVNPQQMTDDQTLKLKHVETNTNKRLSTECPLIHNVEYTSCEYPLLGLWTMWHSRKSLQKVQITQRQKGQATGKLHEDSKLYNK